MTPTNVTGGLERNPGMGPEAQSLPSAFLGGREAVPPEPALPAGQVDLQAQAGTVRDPVALGTLWQSANFPVG